MNRYLLTTRNAAFWRGALVALLLSIAGAIWFAFSAPLMGADLAARVMLIALSFLYLWHLLKAGTRQHVGRQGRVLVLARGALVGFCCWILLIAGLVVFNPSIWIWLMLLITLVWLVRCLRCYQSFFAAAADAVVNGLALMLSLATALHTQSVFLSLWCFFLLQAMVVYLPGTKTVALTTGHHDPEQAFDAACQTAETAIRRMSMHQPGV